MRRATPYVLLGPAVAWVTAVHLLPLVITGSMALSRGSVSRGFEMTWRFANFSDALVAYGPQFARSCLYALAAAIVALLVAYPLAYRMALGSVAWRRVLWPAVVVPFFTPYLIRTLAWETVLADSGPVVGALVRIGALPAGGRVLGTSLAVVGSLAYSYVPFMLLPIYVSLERIDPRHLEASSDLYAGAVRTFGTIVVPQSLPGVVAGSILTFVPAAGDFINAQLLGGPGHSMIGNVIQSRYLVVLDYPAASSLALILVAGLVAGVLAYRLLGEDVAL